ncbi:MAG: Gfo/Idh/MocA family protein [Anaerolineae bacterium]
MKRYALAGASSRSLSMFAKPIVEQYAASAALVGIFDINRVRAQHVSNQCGGAPVFDDFDEMIRAARPDTIIVTTVDRYHHEYIIRALEAGCDAITEKPMTIDDEKVRAILAAEARTGRKVIVTFNYRFTPYVTRIKELLREGVVGRILNIDFEWILDTRHGADYFRRWHRRLENSGGLLVHKATHHFDMLNWWLEDEPQRVFALGKLGFYGPTREARGERCSTCPHAGTCEFFVDYASDPTMKAFYFDAEGQDGYWRDRCVFADEIDIYDTMGVTVGYVGGPMLSYSLIAHSPYEGWRAAINGTGGRLEAEEYHSGLAAQAPVQQVRVFNRRGEQITYDVPKATGGHGGGDAKLQRRLFGGETLPDPLGYMADSRAGAMSVLIGVGANKSIAEGRSIVIEDMLRD